MKLQIRSGVEDSYESARVPCRERKGRLGKENLRPVWMTLDVDSRTPPTLPKSTDRRLCYARHELEVNDHCIC